MGRRPRARSERRWADDLDLDRPLIYEQLASEREAIDAGLAGGEIIEWDPLPDKMLSRIGVPSQRGALRPV